MATFNAIYDESLPSPHRIHQELPASSTQQDFIRRQRSLIGKILDGKDSRLLLVMGPCSIHDLVSAKEYAQKLLQFAKEVEDTFVVVMRVYFEKPRTAVGWKGFLYDPHLNSSNDIQTGIRWTRKLLLDMAEMGVPTAAEFLDPCTALYVSDLISWGCIGARTASSQIHRQMASGLPMPISIKNNTDGNVNVAVQGVLSASLPHSFVAPNMLGQLSMVHTKGNPHAHIVLRGGEGQPNYDPQAIAGALNKLERAHLPLRLLIDCSHDNSFKNHEQQSLVFQSVISQIVEGNKCIRGLILESNLFAGNQHLTCDPSLLQYAVSVTDPCLDWPTTEKLIRWGCAKLKQESAVC